MDRLEVSDVLLSEVLAFLRADWLPQLLAAFDRPQQEDDGQVV